MRFLLAALLLLPMTGCDSTVEPDDRWAVPEDIEFAASLGIDLDAMNRTESGLYWQDVDAGDQESRGVVLEDEVRFHYTIWLPDGTLVETTVGGVPHEREVILLIPGVAEGIMGMRPDGTRKLVVRPELGPPNGYGSSRTATTVVFEIQLITILT